MLDVTAHTTPLALDRFFSTSGEDPFASVRWEQRHVRVNGEGGTVAFEGDVEVPADWSQTSVDIVVGKYFRKAGVPQRNEDGTVKIDGSGAAVTGSETSVRQVIHRLAGTWAHWGVEAGYLTETTAGVYYDEMVHLLLHQLFAPNSPQFFNTGLFWAYGIDGTTRKHFFVDPADGETLVESTSRYQRPAPYACFISRVDDNLTEEGGIADFIAREMRIFQSGGGSGANFSRLRGLGESLSGGGVSSGMMSFLKVFDKVGGAIKSGGTTRRAAKMVVVDVDHPEIEAFVDWKVVEEEKVAALIAQGYDPDWRGEAYQTVSGQNSNNSVSISEEFIRAVKADGDWDLHNRTDGAVAKTIKARDLWARIAKAAWTVADPGLQFNTTMNDWHTAPQRGPINASNPCSEYLSVDDSACNLGSVRLTGFWDAATGTFDVDAFKAAVDLATLTLEISIVMGQLPDATIAYNTHNLRNLGLGYADLGALLMRTGYGYGSAEGRAIAASITSLMTAEAYRYSAQMAAAAGPYGFYDEANHLRVISNHRAVHRGEPTEGLNVEPATIDVDALPDWAAPIYAAGTVAWDAAVDDGKVYGFRNGQVTVLAPTGTISFFLDCDTTGMEPDFSLIKWKTLAGGGAIQIVNRSVEAGLARLGYGDETIAEIAKYVLAHGTIDGADGFDPAHRDVFATAVGANSIPGEGHVRMLGQIAPFLSGAASKTVNLGADATVDDVAGLYMLAHDLGIKAISVYRDGSKLSQVLTSTEDAGGGADAPVNGETKDAFGELVAHVQAGTSPDAFWNLIGIGHAPRFDVTSKRSGFTQEARVGGQKIFLRTGEYADGTLAEIFVDLAKEGATMRGVLSALAMAVSQGLQHGVPLERFVDMFTFQTFEPRGMVEGHPNVKMANSIVDYLFRVLGIEYLGRTDLAHVKPEPGQLRLDVAVNQADTPKTSEAPSSGAKPESNTTPAASLQFGDYTPKIDAAITSHSNGDGQFLTGDICEVCGVAAVVQTGTCKSCAACGAAFGGCG